MPKIKHFNKNSFTKTKSKNQKNNPITNKKSNYGIRHKHSKKKQYSIDDSTDTNVIHPKNYQTKNAIAVTNDDVIKQLKKQREKQKIQKMEMIQNNASNNVSSICQSSQTPKRMGRFIYDSKRKAYFPTTHKKKINLKQSWNHSLNIKNKKQINYSHLQSHLVHSNIKVKHSKKGFVSTSFLHTFNLIPFYTTPSKRKDIIVNMKNKIILHRTKFQPSVIPINVSSIKHDKQSMQKYQNDSKSSTVLCKRSKIDVHRKKMFLHTDNLHFDNHDFDCETNSMIDDFIFHPISDNEIKIKISNSSKQHGWFSMLPPMKKILPHQKNRECIPLDCKSKLNLHPSSRTFSILPSNHSDFLPHIATLVRENPETHSTDVYYRPPISPKPFWLESNKQRIDLNEQFHLPNHQNMNNSNFLSTSSNTNEYNQSIRMTQTNENDNNAFLGLLSYDKQYDIQSFHMYNVGCDGHQNNVKFQMIEKSNDFAFSPSSQGIDKVVFAPVNTSKSKACYPMVLDIPTLSIQPTLRRIHAHSSFLSDTFCIQIQGKSVLYGQRNGYIQIVDQRSGTISHCIQSNFEDHNHASLFGSVTSLIVRNPDATNHPLAFVARGSFGSCHYFDLRCSGSYDRYPQKISASLSSAPNSLVSQMKVPDQEYLDPSATIRCSGIAVCPEQSMCVSPYISNDKTHGTISSRLGIWSLLSGKYIGNLPIKTDKIRGGNQSDSVKPYCELSSTITQAWEINAKYLHNKNNENEISCSVKTNKQSWGLWLKSGSFYSSMDSLNSYSLPPSQTGSIHHAIFPND